MRSTAWHDAIRLRSRRGWFTPVFQLLLVASIVLAVPAAPPIPPSARRAAGLCVRHVLAGCMSWQQSRRKIPPDFAALCDWNGLGVYPHAAIARQRFPQRDCAATAQRVRAAGPSDRGRDRRLPAARSAVPPRRAAAGRDGPQSVARPLFAPGELPRTSLCLVITMAALVINLRDACLVPIRCSTAVTPAREASPHISGFIT